MRRSDAQSERIAQSLVLLEPKLTIRNLNQDLNWDDRVGELFQELIRLDLELPVRLLAQPEFGLPSHMVFVSHMPLALRPQIIAIYAKQIAANPDYPWNY